MSVVENLIKFFKMYSNSANTLNESCKADIAYTFARVKQHVNNAAKLNSKNILQIVKFDEIKNDILQKEAALYRQCSQYEKKISEDQRYIHRNFTKLKSILSSTKSDMKLSLDLKRALISRISAAFVYYREKEQLLRQKYTPSGASLADIEKYYIGKVESILRLNSNPSQPIFVSPYSSVRQEPSYISQELKISIEENIKAVFGSFSEALLTELNNLRSSFNAPKEEIEPILNEIKNQFTSLVDSISREKCEMKKYLEELKAKIEYGPAQQPSPLSEKKVIEFIRQEVDEKIKKPLLEDLDALSETLTKNQNNVEVQIRKLFDGFTKECIQIIKENFNEDSRRKSIQRGTSSPNLDSKLSTVLEYMADNEESGIIQEDSVGSTLDVDFEYDDGYRRKKRKNLHLR